MQAFIRVLYWFSGFALSAGIFFNAPSLLACSAGIAFCSFMLDIGENCC